VLLSLLTLLAIALMHAKRRRLLIRARKRVSGSFGDAFRAAAKAARAYDVGA
jgi:hypothetical protein